MNYKLFSTERGKGKHQHCRACVRPSVQACIFTHQSPMRAPSQALQGSFSVHDNCHKDYQAPHVRSEPAELGRITGLVSAVGTPARWHCSPAFALSNTG